MSDVDPKALMGQPRLRNALEQIREELGALSNDELLLINLDPLAIVAIARGALPKIWPLRAQIALALPTFDLIYLDRLETYALALHHAHTLYCAAKGRREDRTELAAEAYQLRERLLTDVTVLKNRGLFPNANLSLLKGPNGHLNIACDVMSLANLLRDRWEQIAGLCAVTLAELDRAEVLSDELTVAVGNHEPSPEPLLIASAERQRAYTLFVRAYSELRQAITYVRKKERDAEKIAPSLYVRRKTRYQICQVRDRRRQRSRAGGFTERSCRNDYGRTLRHRRE